MTSLLDLHQVHPCEQHHHQQAKFALDGSVALVRFHFAWGERAYWRGALDDV